MHDLEPHYAWRSLYIASEDERSPFFAREYSEFEFTHAVYNYLIHPQWDEFGSATLYMKLLFADYTRSFCVIELIGEWNDCLYNDIMYLKQNVAEILMQNGIRHFILIGENVMDFHASDDLYYQEWFDEIEDGWIACLNFRPHAIREFQDNGIDRCMVFGGVLDQFEWRRFSPGRLFDAVNNVIRKRLGSA